MKKKIHKIMACVDFSDYTLMVLEYAVELAKDSNAQILVFNVINQIDVHMVEFAKTYAPSKISVVQDYIRDLKKERQVMIKNLIKEHFFDEKSIMSFKIDVGIPSEQILKAVQREKIDLIVMANKGRGNVSRFLFGSVAEKVFRHSLVPVVSVRDRKIFKRKGGKL
ncbi:MAG: universal stress protein [Desulfobacula sp.]|nr:universal stress protein [Desulfobacula sp.]